MRVSAKKEAGRKIPASLDIESLLKLFHSLEVLEVPLAVVAVEVELGE